MLSLVYENGEENKDTLICLYMVHIHQIPLKGHMTD